MTIDIINGKMNLTFTQELYLINYNPDSTITIYEVTSKCKFMLFEKSCKNNKIMLIAIKNELRNTT